MARSRSLLRVAFEPMIHYRHSLFYSTPSWHQLFVRECVIKGSSSSDSSNSNGSGSRVVAVGNDVFHEIHVDVGLKALVTAMRNMIRNAEYRIEIRSTVLSERIPLGFAIPVGEQE
ncbi:hypothetical protein HZH66_010358 [Vespula vulgaris]|uniref:Uncharacterized protein n=1 Tax=Vespula vulgaris TaxID=7454 RepID=A0A834JPM5_VESVU|nr:hypothetical protein HZH66_010358 [Vespula vulgaris]